MGRSVGAAKREDTVVAESLDPNLSIAAVRITEDAAIAATRFLGAGDERAADAAAIDAMSAGLAKLPVHATIMVGEGLEGAADRLYIGQRVGMNGRTAAHIALDPLEGATTTARGEPNAISVLTIASEDGVVSMPDIYMEKIAVGPRLPQGVIDLDKPPAENLAAVAKAKGIDVRDLVVCILDRPRHAELVAKVREVGARITLIQDGDISGIVATAVPASGIDIYMGIGGAPEAVLAATALKSIGGQMLGRLVLRNDDDREKSRRCGLDGGGRIFTADDLAPGECVFAATGVTSGMILKGVRRVGGGIFTHSLVMCSGTVTVRWLETYHNVQNHQAER